jgi:hypothetical protein
MMNKFPSKSEFPLKDFVFVSFCVGSLFIGKIGDFYVNTLIFIRNCLNNLIINKKK